MSGMCFKSNLGVRTGSLQVNQDFETERTAWGQVEGFTRLLSILSYVQDFPF